MDSSTNSCRKCHSSCETCSGKSVNQCISCDKTLGKFLNFKFECGGCPTGFKFDAESLSCLEICGDGLNFGQHECDDSNSKNNDGCSDKCSIDLDWECIR